MAGFSHPGPPYPKYLWSRRIGQVAIATNLQEELNLRNSRFDFAPVELHVPLNKFPKTVWHDTTGETRVIHETRDEQLLDWHWLEKGEHKLVDTEYPKAMYLPDGRNTTVRSAAEEKALGEHWVDGHEFWCQPNREAVREMSAQELAEYLVARS